MILTFLLSVSPEEYRVDPYSVFQSSDSLLSTAQSFEYDFRFSGTGSLGNIIPVVTGETSLYRSAGVPHPLMVLDFLLIEREGAPGGFTVPSSYIASEDSLYRFEHTSSRVFSGPVSRDAAGIFNFPQASVMMELVLYNPFEDELNADSIAVLIPDSVEGTLCHVFHVYYGGDSNAEAVWYIGFQDHLPRAVERLGKYGRDGEPGGELLEIWNLNQPHSLPDPGEQAPDVFLADTDGFVKRISFPAEKPVLLLFFTSGGSNSLSALGTAEELYLSGLDVYGISVLENGDTLFRLGSLDIAFPVLLFGEDTSDEYSVRTVPSAVLVDSSGKVVASAEGLGEIDSDAFREAAASLL